MNNQSFLPTRQTDTEATTVENPTRVLAVLVDDHVQEILSATGRHPLSAEDLASTCNLSLSTIYRKTDQLVELDFLTEQYQVSTEGRHRRKFRSNIDRVEATYTSANQLTVKVHWRDCNESSLKPQRTANTR